VGNFIWPAILLGGIGGSFIMGGCGSGPVSDDDDGEDDTDDTDDVDVGPVGVEGTLPAPGATGVDADLSIVVRFSSRIRPESVNEETFAVTGPLGAVAGGYAIEEEVVTFIPAAPWHLLGHYDVTMTDIVGYVEDPLAEPYAWGFDVGEGDWSDRVDLATDVGDFVDLARNRRGDMILAFTTTSQPASVKAVRFDSGSRWPGRPPPTRALAAGCAAAAPPGRTPPSSPAPPAAWV
jgi:hypothetical protein